MTENRQFSCRSAVLTWPKSHVLSVHEVVSKVDIYVDRQNNKNLKANEPLGWEEWGQGWTKIPEKEVSAGQGSSLNHLEPAGGWTRTQ